MSIRTVSGILAGLAFAAGPSAAQDAPPPPVFQVTTLELSPSTLVKFRNGLQKQAEAAKAVNLPAGEVGWWTYSEGNRLIIVAPRPRDNLLVNPMTRARIREANPALDQGITDAYAGAQARLASQELIVHAPNLSRDGSAGIEPMGAQVAHIMIAPGQGQVFNEAIQAMNKVRADIGYPYSVQLYRVRFGETRTMIVTFFDSREAFVGRNSIQRLLEGKPEAQAAWQAAIDKVLSATASYRFELVDYAPALSYPPMP